MNNYRAGQFLKAPKLGNLKIKWSRVPNGAPKMVTVSMDNTSKYWASMSIEEKIQPKERRYNSVGVDVGVEHFAILNNGKKIERPRFTKTFAAQLKKLQQRLARQNIKYNRRKQTKKRIAALHQKIANARLDFLHQVEYMGVLLELSSMQKRIFAYIHDRNTGLVEGYGKIKESAGILLYNVFILGKLDRLTAKQLTGEKDTSAKRMLAQLREDGLLSETSHKSDLFWEIPEHAERWYFPGLIS